jgi:hypothetical protein
MAKILAACACAASVAFVARDAGATDCTGTLASTCINDDTLWPHAGPARFIGVGGAETIADGQVGFGLVTSYLSRPIVLRTSSPGPSANGNGQDQYAIDNQVNSTFLWGYGITDRLELDFALPITLGQSGTGVAPITGGNGVQDTAMRDLRFGLAYAIVPRPRISVDVPSSSAIAKKSAFGLAARMEASAPTGDRDQFAGERSAVWMPSLAGDYRRGPWFAGLEVGARIRPTTELVGTRIGTQLYTAAGIGFDILKKELLSVAAEARALPTFAEQHTAQPSSVTGGLLSTPNGEHITPAEWTVSARSAPLAGGDLAFQLGGGGAFTTDPAATTPRYRFMLSLRYAPLGHDTDGDGVLDKDDHCPNVRGDRADGCATPNLPQTPAAPATPEIVLHLKDAKDPCTSEPDSVDGFRDDDGCADEDADKDGIDDRHDKCPLQPEDFSGLTEGCPDANAPTPPPQQPPPGGQRNP